MPSWIDSWKNWAAKSFGVGGSKSEDNAEKAFRLGPAIVEPADQYMGKDPGVFNPEAYGRYIATSTGVYACATLRAETLASVPLRLYKGEGDNVDTVEKGQLHELLSKVNPFWTLPFLVEMTELALDLWGEAFWVMERGQNGKGTPKEIWWASPDKMRPVPDPVNYLAGYVFEHNGERLAFAVDEVIWFRNPNPIDEYEGLSPIAAARLSIDLGQAGLKSNKAIFDQGNQMAGVVSPADKDAKMSPEQANTLREMLARRFRGVDNAHKIAVLNHAVKFDSVQLSPKDAEFLGQMRWSLGDVCRVYKVSPILVQDLEHSTYSNFDQALKALYTLCLIPQARRIEAWLNEQLLPLFPGEADYIEFDFSEVAVLQEAEESKWNREQGQIEVGAITINEWRAKQGLDPVPWGNERYRPATAAAPQQDPDDDPDDPNDPPRRGKPKKGDSKEDATEAGEDGHPATEIPPDDGSAKAAAARALWAVKALSEQTDQTVRKVIELDSKEHIAAFKKFDRKATRHEKKFKAVVTKLFEEQQASILAKMEAAKAINEQFVAVKAVDPDDPFDIDEWIDNFKTSIHASMEEIVEEAGESVYDELKIEHNFDMHNPEVEKFLGEREQRFAEQVNKTTWDKLKTSLSEGEKAGDGIPELMKRVEDVMGDRIRSSAEVIARTEVIGALNGGALQAAKQSGVVTHKSWLAAIDDRTRHNHRAAHTKYQANPIPIDAEFEVGMAKGQAPGQLGSGEEDIQCRCTMTWEVDETPVERPLEEGKHVNLIESSLSKEDTARALGALDRAKLLDYLEKNPMGSINIQKNLKVDGEKVGGVYSWNRRRLEVDTNQKGFSKKFNPGKAYTTTDGSADGFEAMQRAIVHETAHHIHNVSYSMKVGKLGSTLDTVLNKAFRKGNPITKYAAVNKEEYFAETLTAYTFHKDALLKHDPVGHAMIEEVLTAMGVKL